MDITLFITEILISLGLSTAVLFAISRPLMNALLDLCPTEKQAAFWLSYTRTMLLLAPLLLVLVVDGTQMYENTLDNIKVALMAALAGVLLGMIIVGKRIFIPAVRQCEHNRQGKQA